MNNLLSQLTVICILVVCVGIVFATMGLNVTTLLTKERVWTRKKPKEKTDFYENDNEYHTEFYDKDGDVNSTKVYRKTKRYEKPHPDLIVEEWHDGNMINRFLINQIPDRGVVVGCMPKDKRGLKIKGNSYIGGEHVRIVRKENDGIYVVDNASLNGLFDAMERKVNKVKIDPAANTFVFLGDPKINVKLKIYRAPQNTKEINFTRQVV